MSVRIDFAGDEDRDHALVEADGADIVEAPIEQDEDYILVWTFTDENGATLDITGWSIEASVATDPEGAANGGVHIADWAVTIDGPNGTATLQLDRTDTNAIYAGYDGSQEPDPDPNPPEAFFYVTDNAGVRDRTAWGRIWRRLAHMKPPAGV